MIHAAASPVGDWIMVIISGAGVAMGAGLYKLGAAIGQLSAVVKTLEARDAEHEARINALEHRRNPKGPSSS